METPQIFPASAANFKMIDIGEKTDTQRRAVASGMFFAAPSTILRIKNGTLPKGDVLTLSEVSGIQGAKKTADLLPLCHPLSLSSVRVWHEVSEAYIRIYCEAKVLGKTGVEMEALAGVSTALLCIYDLTKGIDPALHFGEIKLEIKEGGKSGRWLHPGSLIAKNLIESRGNIKEKKLEGVISAVMVMSDRCFRGESEDRSGPAAERWLSEQGSKVVLNRVLPDDHQLLSRELAALIKRSAPDLVITSGGTGLSPRDITPETILSVARELGGREVPGIGELLRAEGAKKTEMSWLSRSTAVLIGKTLIVCLPGSPVAVIEGLDSIKNIISHAIHISVGGDHTKK